MSNRQHQYAARLVWDGNTGQGTASYQNYRRDYHLELAGKPDLSGSADPLFRGSADRYNPEELMLAAVSACHMLSYLALCARHGISVLAYADEARATLALLPNGAGRFEEFVLHPRVRIADGADAAMALELHDAAHQQCFIANSCSAPIRHQPIIETA